MTFGELPPGTEKEGKTKDEDGDAVFIEGTSSARCKRTLWMLLAIRTRRGLQLKIVVLFSRMLSKPHVSTTS